MRMLNVSRLNPRRACQRDACIWLHGKFCRLTCRSSIATAFLSKEAKPSPPSQERLARHRLGGWGMCRAEGGTGSVDSHGGGALIQCLTEGEPVDFMARRGPHVAR
jgi:hypothetical protein